ncbi:MAG: alcohol dehydrogenase catalytic domain-containing protein, partial [Planctomycetota bacterium]
MGKMLAAVLLDFDKLELKEIPIPKAENVNEAVIKIKSCGFCATDYKAIKGIRKNVKFPIIVGHEPSGIVHQVGPGVEQFKVGDEVIVQPLGHCGLCKHCRTGNTHYCENAFVTGGDGPDDVWDGA